MDNRKILSTGISFSNNEVIFSVAGNSEEVKRIIKTALHHDINNKRINGSYSIKNYDDGSMQGNIFISFGDFLSMQHMLWYMNKETGMGIEIELLKDMTNTLTNSVVINTQERVTAQDAVLRAASQALDKKDEQLAIGKTCHGMPHEDLWTSKELEANQARIKSMQESFKFRLQPPPESNATDLEKNKELQQAQRKLSK